jgi:predicted ester cyclase
VLTAEQNRAIIRRFLEETWNHGNLAVIDEVLAAEYLSHDPAAPSGRFHRPEEFKRFVTTWRNAFPDFRLTVEDLVAEGDRVVDRVSWRGAHRGEILGIAPTGAQETLTEMHIARMVDRKIVERWVASDLLGLLQQLGALPPPDRRGR